MHQVILRPRAIKMAKDAYDWYEEQQVGLGDLFFDELENAYDKLELWPSLYIKVKKDFQQLILRKFPYVIVYKVTKKT